MSGTVYVPNIINLEYTVLTSWGEVAPIFNGHIYPDTFNEMQDFKNQAFKALSNFNKDMDYIGLVGDPALQALAMLTLGFTLSIDTVRVLKYDKRLVAYYPITLRVS